MSNPTVSNEPREGLPPCVIRAAKFDGRIAWWSVTGRCECVGADRNPPTNRVLYGQHGPAPNDRRRKWLCRDWFIVGKLPFMTDDPDEAQAAFERGAEWVRTGEMA